MVMSMLANKMKATATLEQMAKLGEWAKKIIESRQ